LTRFTSCRVFSCVSIVNLQEVFSYIRYYFLISYLIYKYFLFFTVCAFTLFIMFLRYTSFNFDVIWFICFFIASYAFVVKMPLLKGPYFMVVFIIRKYSFLSWIYTFCIISPHQNGRNNTRLDTALTTKSKVFGNGLWWWNKEFIIFTFYSMRQCSCIRNQCLLRHYSACIRDDMEDFSCWLPMI
jgi:hypothetical protein